MKEFYVAPEAEVIRFVAEENIANENEVSVLDWNVENNADADGGNIDNYGKWFD